MSGVGILAMEVYFPSLYVSQSELEQANNVSSGKYTIGLGQDNMAFVGDREDINSISLTVVKSLLEKYNISPLSIGRLEIGTESLVDKSKSTKTVIMSLFEESGNHDIEGATVVNACYGGTAALLNALTWADSSSYDGRYAIVVAADIAVYSDGPARPTGGCGAVAMLIGRNAPLQFNLQTRSTYATHVWDFFKPNMDSEYPEVNGALSQNCYLRALDDCYSRYISKQMKFETKSNEEVGINKTDVFLFHSPYNKLVQKSFARLVYNDILSNRFDENYRSMIQEWINIPIEDTYDDKKLENKLKEIAGPLYDQKVASSCELSKNIGNTYTASVYMNLANLISNQGKDLAGKKISLFSYGSGALATMIEISPTNDCNQQFSLENIQRALDINTRLASREKRSPDDLNNALDAREKSHGFIPFSPTFEIDHIFPGTYYLESINTNYERIYLRKPLQSIRNIGSIKLRDDVKSLSLHAPSEDEGITIDDVDIEDNDRASPLPSSTLFKKNSKNSLSNLPGLGLTRSKTMVWASGRPNIRVVVTGISAALPGRDKAVFTPGVNNIQRIINGEQCISLIPNNVRDSMINKNVVQLVKNKDGSQTKKSISTYDEQIAICASIGQFSLTSYGVPESIASTMDIAVQVSVAAGLEALKDAKIVSGEGGLSGWELPESMQQTTGIVYATSFPALDTAIAEVSKYFETKTVEKSHIPRVIDILRQRLHNATGTLSTDVENALEELKKVATSLVIENNNNNEYEFDRKFLFRVLVLGNAQLAQIIKARGPNMQTNAACAGSTQAVALAYDMIQVGRAERMIVIAGDNAASDTLMPWLGNGFRALGAATICPNVEMAALPFDIRRSGMILGSGGIGMVLESEEGAKRRFAAMNQPQPGLKPFKCRLLGTLISNSAYHGAAMDKNHIASEMERFISSVEKEQGISRKEIALNGVYFSHETCTHSSPTSSCSYNEIYGLRKVFGEDLKHLLILNTKCYTGHPMGVSFEDVVAAEVLVNGIVPPLANTAQIDPNLGSDIKLSKGGKVNCKYAMRFAAGFGSQVAIALYGSGQD